MTVKMRNATREAFGEEAVTYADDLTYESTSLRAWLEESVMEYFDSQQAKSNTDIFAMAKKINKAFDIAKEDIDRVLVDDKSNVGTIDAPKQIANTPPVLQLIEPEETPLYARAADYGADNALVDLAKDVMAQKKTFREKLGTTPFLEAEMQLIDMRAGLREALKAGAKEIGDDRLFTQAMSHVIMADQKMAMTNASLQKGPMEVYTDEKGFYGVRSTGKDSAVDVFKSVADIPQGNSEAKANIATIYMIAKRALNKGLAKLDLGALGVTEAKLKAALAAADADPKLKAALENTRAAYNAYNEGQIKFLASTGAITKKEADRLLKDGDFVPFYRVNENGMAQLVFSDEVTVTIGDVRRQPYLQELKGGETRILPITETIQRNTLLITDKALTNLATKNIAYAFQAIGEGKGPAGKDGKPTNAMPIHVGTGPASPDVIRFNQEPDPNKPNDTGERWQRVKTDDTLMGGIPAQLIVKSLEGAHLTLPAFLKAGGYAADILRSGVTRMPIYLARQLVRDPMAAAFTGGLDYNPLTAVVKAGREFIASSRGQSATNEEMLKKGLIQSGIFTGDPDDMAKIALQLAGGKDQGILDKVFAAADRAAMRADAATRALVYENARRQGLSEVEADMAVRESMNFYKRGLSPTVQYASRLIPFFNAQIQGLNVLYKAARGQTTLEDRRFIQQKFFNNALLLVGTGIVYAMAMDDDPYFRNAKPRDKYSNFFLPLPGIDEPLKLPIPYEAGWFFSLAVAAVDAMKAETDGVQQWQALRDMFLQSVPGYSSKFMPQIVKPAFEVWTNKNFFNNTAIESARLEKLSPEQRFTETTTEAAKALGKAVPILSPIQIEHIATGYFGQLPLIIAGAANGLFRTETRGEPAEKRVTDLPFIGSSFQKKYGGADTDVMYRLSTEAMQAKTTFDDLRKKGQVTEAKDYLEDNRVLIASAPLARNYQNVMGKLRADADRINNSERMSAAEKRARLNKIDEARQDVADKFENAMRKIRDGGKT
jgi:predicted house-cleaning noncanonical NTP pyrophosphatase (MazG superfamily)